MLLNFFLCHALFLPVLSSVNIIITNDTNISVNNTETEKVLGTTIITEGGPTVQSTPITLSTLGHDTLLMSLTKDLEGEKTMQQPSTSNIVARKYVEYHDNTTVVQDKMKTNNDTQGAKKPILIPALMNISSAVHKKNTTESKTSQKPNKANQTTTLPHKPRILSNELLDRMKPQNADLDNNSGPSKNILPMSTSRHPGMVMPIVITILVVPMFAVLGYMALRRGQEAWKNRHYKRMDFLLDGMYNE